MARLSVACTVTWMPRAKGPECGTNAKSAVTPVAAAAQAVISGMWRCTSAL